MLRSELCDYRDAYIVVKGTINVTGPNNNAYDKKLAFENNAHSLAAFQELTIGIVMPNIQFHWLQQKLFKNNRNFVEVLQRWTK